MDKDTFAFSLLSLFTTRERALEIEGDLVEEREFRGHRWFVIHVLGVTLALFRESLREAPLRTAALVALTTGLAFQTCRLQSSLFLAPDAFYPSPLLGILMIPLCGFMTGWGLHYFWSGLAVRSAALTSALLSCALIITLTAAESASFALAAGSGSIMPVMKAALSIALAFVHGIALYVGPLLAGSIYHRDIRMAR